MVMGSISEKSHDVLPSFGRLEGRHAELRVGQPGHVADVVGLEIAQAP